MSEFDQVPVPTERPKTTFAQQFQKGNWPQAKIRNYLVIGLILYTAVSYFVFIMVGNMRGTGITWPATLPLATVVSLAFGGGGTWLLYMVLIYAAGLVGIALIYISTIRLIYSIEFKRTAIIVGSLLLVLHLPQILLTQVYSSRQAAVAQKYVDTYVEVFSQADPQLFGGTFPLQEKMKHLSTLHLDYSQELGAAVSSKENEFNPESNFQEPYLSFAADGNHFCIYANPTNVADPSGVASYRGSKKSTEKCKAAREIGNELDSGQYDSEYLKAYVVVGEGNFQQQGPYKYGVNSDAYFSLGGTAFYKTLTENQVRYSFTLNAFPDDFPGHTPRNPILN
jgi:hypothetical protein